MLVVCVSSGLTIGYWMTDLCSLPWGRLPATLSTPQPLLPEGFCVGLRHPRISAVHVSMPMVVTVQLIYMRSHVGDFNGCISWHCLDTQSNKLWSFLSPLLNLRWGSCFVDMSMGTGSTTLQFSWLWFSVKGYRKTQRCSHIHVYCGAYLWQLIYGSSLDVYQEVDE